MPKRKLDDLLKRRDAAASNPVKHISKSTEHPGPEVSTITKDQHRNQPPQKRLKRTKTLSGPVDVSKELSLLKYSTSQNKDLPKLPSNTTISRRPINHGPIASRFAGAHVPKVVYISRKTPVISAVKRVKQFLREIEKRAMQSLGVDGVINRNANGKNGDRELQIKLGQVSDKLEKDKEEVLVKASGRAIEQALRIGEWFRHREDEMLCNVEVRTGSVSVVDDIVEVEAIDEPAGTAEHHDEHEVMETQEHNTSLEVGDTTMELLKNLEGVQHAATESTEKDMTEAPAVSQAETNTSTSHPKRKRKKSKKQEYDQDDLPEARLRWVKTVEVAVSLRA